MKILSIDTSTAFVYLALIDGNQIIDEFQEKMDRGQAENLIPQIDELLKKNQWRAGELDRVAVGIGPGSFTGVRVAIACAKGIGLALNIPVVGVNSFDAISYYYSSPVCVLLDTRRDDFYVKIFDETDEEATVMTLNDVLKIPFKKVSDILIENTILDEHNRAVSIGLIASKIDTINEPHPFYLREADVG